MFSFDKNWSLFLDRDGVINRRIIDGYVRTPDEFVFLEGAPEAIALFTQCFNHIFIVTNQQGIGKGLMTENDLEQVHHKMLSGISEAGGNITRIYHCPYLASQHSIYRKPNIGMALKARKEFNDVNLKRSVMIGDSVSDLQFGKTAKMKTVFISDNLNKIRQNWQLIDAVAPSLIDAAHILTKTK